MKSKGSGAEPLVLFLDPKFLKASYLYSYRLELYTSISKVKKIESTAKMMGQRQVFSPPGRSSINLVREVFTLGALFLKTEREGLRK